VVLLHWAMPLGTLVHVSLFPLCMLSSLVNMVLLEFAMG